jgi:hypothetical protein
MVSQDKAKKRRIRTKIAASRLEASKNAAEHALTALGFTHNVTSFTPFPPSTRTSQLSQLTIETARARSDEDVVEVVCL